ncbi:MAG TPA: DUF4988 domain-containing protein [Candidatus Coprenecus pullistercoris]|nr:DUF4988 domain-containing protein [Candidatus Coprenecus pullistercoris]
MKRLILIMTSALLLAALGACSKYDDSALKDRLSGISDRVDSLETQVEAIQSGLDALQAIVDKLDGTVTVDAVDVTEDGCVISFSDGTEVALSNGKDGSNGTPGVDGVTPPSITILEEDGVLYWGYAYSDGTTEFILVDGQKVPTSTSAPQIRINDAGFWEFSNDGGLNWVPTDISAADSGEPYFTSLVEEEDSIVITLAGGAQIVLPKTAELSFAFLGEDGSPITAAYFEYGQSKSVAYSMTEGATLTLNKPDGWRASVDGDNIVITAPAEDNIYAELYGEVSALVTLEDGSNMIASLELYIGAEPAPGGELEPGNYLYADGTWSPALYAGKEVIGVVFWVGDLTAEDAELAADHPECTHGLAVSLNYAGNKLMWSPSEAIYEWADANSDIVNNIENTSNIVSRFEAWGYSNTKVMDAYVAAGNGCSLVTRMNSYREDVPAPDVTSGWFIPSIQEFARLACGPVEDYRQLYGAELIVAEKVNAALAAIDGADEFNFDSDKIWLCQENAANKAHYGYFVDDSGTEYAANSSYAFKNNSDQYLRLVIAF